MLSGLSAQELGVLARSGASLEIDGKSLPSSDICKLAREMTRGSELVLHNSSRMFFQELCQIARASGISNVRFL